ncbi:MAG: thioredoxin family protein [Fuerstiella sp.]
MDLQEVKARQQRRAALAATIIERRVEELVSGEDLSWPQASESSQATATGRPTASLGALPGAPSTGSLAEQKTEILYFRAAWCKPCQEMDDIVNRCAESESISLRIVDVTADPSIARTHHVDRIPTVVLLRNDHEIGRRSGVTSFEQLRGFFRAPIGVSVRLRSIPQTAPYSEQAVTKSTAGRRATSDGAEPGNSITAKTATVLRVSFTDLAPPPEKQTDEFTEKDVAYMQKQLEHVDGERIRIRGFMYPTFKTIGLTAFTMARDNEICCFSRQPKIYDIIGISLADGQTTDFIDSKPFNVEGVLRIAPEADDTELYELYFIDNARVVQ